MHKESHLGAKKGSVFFSGLPLLFFIVTYIIANMLGGIIILFDVKPFSPIVQFFSGVHIPLFSSVQFIQNFQLLFFVPIIMIFGFVLVAYGVPAVKYSLDRQVDGIVKEFLIKFSLSWVVFAILAIFAMISISKIGVVFHLIDWLNYRSFIHERVFAFKRLIFFDFVNIYTLLPLISAYIFILSAQARQMLLARWFPVLLAIFFNICLFQKKPTIVAEFLIFVPFLLYSAKFFSNKKIVFRVFFLIILLMTTYFIMLLLPTLHRRHHEINKAVYSKRIHFSSSRNIKTIYATVSLSRFNMNHEIVKLYYKDYHFPRNQRYSRLLYLLFGMVTRTSFPALYYPVVFPKLHPFYRFDFGQDIIGFGQMPNDNYVVWHVMNPHMSGLAAAPFQFVLFSQIGLVGSLALSFLVGILLALFWKWALYYLFKDNIFYSLLGSLLLLFSVYIAIDSVRNSLFAAYGVIWGAFFILFFYGVQYITISYFRSRATKKSSEQFDY